MRPTFGEYYALIDRSILNHLDQQTPENLLVADREEYLLHLIREAAWEPLKWNEAGKTVEPFTEKRQRRDVFGDPFTADVQMFRLRIPISRHSQRSDFFRRWPSAFRLSGEPDWKFEGDVLIVETEASAEAVKRALDEVHFWIGGRNEDIEAGNATLSDRIRPIWENRRAQLEVQHERAQSEVARLGIPLHGRS